eukprot:scaffold10482_cov116-Isochrysis_galbana.AAC.5
MSVPAGLSAPQTPRITLARRSGVMNCSTESITTASNVAACELKSNSLAQHVSASTLPGDASPLRAAADIASTPLCPGSTAVTMHDSSRAIHSESRP